MAFPSVSNTNNHGGTVANAKTEKKAKRTKSPGVRLVGNIIYDSTNGITCHQCRQKTRSFAASCKNQKNGKPCVIKYCHKCLKNRYGEIAEEVELLHDWICPKCRGFCNCSCCMKRRGESPTGPMVHTAKASGFKSVSEMLSVNSEGKVNDVAVSPMTESALKKDSRITGVDKSSCGKELVVVISGEPGKENSVDESSGLKLDSLKAQKALSKKSRKTKREGLKEISNGKNVDDSSQDRSSKRPKVCDEAQEDETKGNANNGTRACKEVTAKEEEAKEATKVDGVNAGVKSQAATTVFHGVSQQEMKVGRNDEIIPVPMDGPEVWGANDFFLPPSMWASNDTFFNQSEAKEGMYWKIWKGTVVPVDDDNAVVKSQAGIAKAPKVRTCTVNSEREEIQVEVPLPTGTVLTNIADVEFQPEDVGNALQFLEFCRSFGKVIDVKKGEGEAIIRELVRKQNLRRGQNTLAVQFQIRLLTLIQIDSGIESPSLTPASGNNSWLKALEDIISESDLVLKDFPLDWLEEGISGYYNLELSTKLRVLNFLCDETLCTAKLRTYIDDQNVRFAEEKKEAKSKVAAAKEKERSLKQKLQDKVAKAITSNEAPLSIAEHEALVSKIKSEAAQAHAEVLEAKGVIPQGKQNSDAVRTEPVFLDGSGRAFWKLRSYNCEDAVLLQDIKMEDATAATPDESWLVYGPEKKEEVDKYISSRAAKPRIRKVTPPPIESIEANMSNASEEHEAKE